MTKPPKPLTGRELLKLWSAAWKGSRMVPGKVRPSSFDLLAAAINKRFGV